MGRYPKEVPGAIAPDGCQFDYMQVILGDNEMADPAKGAAILKALGKDGWDAYAVAPHGMRYLVFLKKVIA